MVTLKIHNRDVIVNCRDETLVTAMPVTGNLVVAAPFLGHPTRYIVTYRSEIVHCVGKAETARAFATIAFLGKDIESIADTIYERWA